MFYGELLVGVGKGRLREVFFGKSVFLENIVKGG